MTEVTWAASLAATTLLFVWLTLGRRRMTLPFAVLLGLLVGGSTLIRGEGALLSLVFGLVWLLSGLSLQRAAALTAACVLGVAVMLGGWALRNELQMGAPVPISTGSSSTLAQSHWEGADGGPNFRRGAVVQGRYEDVPYPEREVKWSQRAMRDAMKYAVTHPVRELTLIPRRFFELMRHDHAPIDYITKQTTTGTHEEFRVGQKTFDAFTVLSDVYYAAMLVAAVLGARLWWRARREMFWLLLGIAVYIFAVFSIAFLGEPRYHASLIPIFALLAAPALAQVASRVMGPQTASEAAR
jgi:hypothetical protein